MLLLRIISYKLCPVQTRFHEIFGHGLINGVFIVMKFDSNLCRSVNIKCIGLSIVPINNPINVFFPLTGDPLKISQDYRRKRNLCHIAGITAFTLTPKLQELFPRPPILGIIGLKRIG
jgi:hypothetical protein